MSEKMLLYSLSTGDDTNLIGDLSNLTTISKTPSVTISVSAEAGVRVNKIIGYKY